METQELEKMLEKLKSVDLQRWKYQYEPAYSRNFLSVETDGLRFSIVKNSDSGYELYIENAEERMTNNCFIDYKFDKKSKNQLKLINEFYEKTLTSLKEHKHKTIKEKFDDFLKE